MSTLNMTLLSSTLTVAYTKPLGPAVRILSDSDSYLSPLFRSLDQGSSEPRHPLVAPFEDLRVGGLLLPLLPVRLLVDVPGMRARPHAEAATPPTSVWRQGTTWPRAPGSWRSRSRR